MARDLIIWETDHRSLKLSIRKLFLILRADKSLSILIAIFVMAGLLLGFSGHFISPYVSQETYSDHMYSYQVMPNGLNYPNQKLNIYALAPNYPIYLTIQDNQHILFDYSIYFINDTGNAVGFGPTTLLYSGQITNTTSLVLPHTIYHMTYRLVLEASGLPSFDTIVTYTQTVYLYPPSNYYLLIPGIMMALVGVVLTGSKIMNIASDKDKYYSNLKFKDPHDAYIVQNLGRSSRASYYRYPWYTTIFFGLISCAAGFIIFGRQFILSWFGIILIIIGISLMLNGLIRYFSHHQ